MKRRNNMAKLFHGITVAAVCWGFIVLTAPQAAAKEYLIGLACDRTGPTSTVGKIMCGGFHDYVMWHNAKNKLPGHTVKVTEIDHGYNVPRGVEAYQRLKDAGALTIGLYGTPIIAALTKQVHEDHISSSVPGGAAFAADGERWPYLFPAAASYWSQSSAAMQFITDSWKGDPKKLKVAYLFYDNPAGREPLSVIHDIRDRVGFELREFAVPPPGIEMRPQVLDIARRYRADWVLIHVFGRATAVALKEFSRVGFPMEHMIGMVWAGAESDLDVVGWENAQGYNTLQMAHVGSSRANPNHPILKDIVEIYKARGDEPPSIMDASVFYNRGIMWGAFHTAGIVNAVNEWGADIDSVQTRKGLEMIREMSLDDFMPPLTITTKDHEGGGYVRVFQVHEHGYRPVSKWIHGYRDIVLKHVAAIE